MKQILVAVEVVETSLATFYFIICYLINNYKEEQVEEKINGSLLWGDCYEEIQ